MHQQHACSVRSGIVVSDLSRKENNLLLVYKDVSEREVGKKEKWGKTEWGKIITLSEA